MSPATRPNAPHTARPRRKTRWKSALAARALRQDGTPMAAVARSVGYASESSFSNAFKRTVGVAPRRYRDTAG
jgi:AraC-like DNA-binding protein